MRVGVITRAVDWRNVLQKGYQDIFFKKGNVLGVTGETFHEIPLKKERVKERRH